MALGLEDFKISFKFSTWFRYALFSWLSGTSIIYLAFTSAEPG